MNFLMTSKTLRPYFYFCSILAFHYTVFDTVNNKHSGQNKRKLRQKKLRSYSYIFTEPELCFLLDATTFIFNFFFLFLMSLAQSICPPSIRHPPPSCHWQRPLSYCGEVDADNRQLEDYYQFFFWQD